MNFTMFSETSIWAFTATPYLNNKVISLVLCQELEAASIAEKKYYM
jgi:hypothetical protein